MKHMETYIDILKRREIRPTLSSVPLNVDLPGLKQEAGLTNVRKYELLEERKFLLKFIEMKEKEIKKAKGEKKKELTSSVKGARAKLKELSLILGPVEISIDAK